MQIVTLGGGGFSTGSEPGLDAYLIAQARVAHPRIGFIATASGDSEEYLEKFYARFSQLDCQPSHLPFFRRTPDLDSWIATQDVIFVGGGNTKSMLAIWRDWGLIPLLQRAGDEGTLLTGISAGAICWFEQGVTESAAVELGPIDGLGLLAGSACPHYSGEPERRPAYERLVGEGRIAPGFAIDDGAALHFVDGRATRLIVGRTGALAHRVEREGRTGVSIPIDRVEGIDVERIDARTAEHRGAGAGDDPRVAE